MQEFHSNTKAKVVVGGRMSDAFDVLVGVKQGCVPVPVIFNLFLVVVCLVSRDSFPPDAGVPFIYRLDDSLFNIRHLKAETKVSRDRIFELQYADDADMPAHSATALRAALTHTLSTAYTDVLESLSVPRRPKSCLLSPIMTLSHLLFGALWSPQRTGVYSGEHIE